MFKLLFAAVSVAITLTAAGASPAQEPPAHAIDTLSTGKDSGPAESPDDSSTVIFFRFVPKVSMFYFDRNEKMIHETDKIIDFNRKAIENGQMLITVDGYSSSFVTEGTNYKIARLRSSQVKSYLITNSGMKEEYFKTANHTSAYEDNPEIGVRLGFMKKEDKVPGQQHVTVAEIGPAPAEEVPAEPAEPAAKADDELPDEDGSAPACKAAEPEPGPEPLPETEIPVLPAASGDESLKAVPFGSWKVKTNIPAWALVVANAAVEYRFAEHWSVDIPLYYSCWTTARTYRFRTLALQPSLRYWIDPEWKGHFFGAHLTGGQYNISVDERTRYQDVDGMYGIGLDYGYALELSRHWGLEFNLGAGYIYTRYDSFYNIDNGALFNTATKHYWGLTRCGISIIYKI